MLIPDKRLLIGEKRCEGAALTALGSSGICNNSSTAVGSESIHKQLVPSLTPGDD